MREGRRGRPLLTKGKRMAITADDINNQSFSIERKGYDVDEVDVFLEHVAEEIDGLNNTIASLEKQLEAARASESDSTKVVAKEDLEAKAEEKAEAKVEETAPSVDKEHYENLIAEKDVVIADLTNQLDEKKANDNAISQALIIAQRSADEIVEKANIQANDTIQDARDEATRILNRANNDRQAVIDSIHKLEDDREDAREEYQDILRDFIADATRKLADLGSLAVGEGQDRDDGPLSQDEAAPAQNQGDEAFAAVAGDNADASASFAAVDEGTAAAEPVASVYEKDLSGFGDADDFEFEEID